MADIVNLNRFRKAKAKAAAEVEADNNRIAFGRTKAGKEAERKARDKARAELDARKLDAETLDE